MVRPDAYLDDFTAQLKATDADLVTRVLRTLDKEHLYLVRSKTIMLMQDDKINMMVDDEDEKNIRHRFGPVYYVYKNETSSVAAFVFVLLVVELNQNVTPLALPFNISLYQNLFTVVFMDGRNSWFQQFICDKKEHEQGSNCCVVALERAK
ncbi:hypothetical protein Btru_064189 [Bulinus truncatus]|nr:hypothetical protein Btru_064189 [Bulinus truncatus]